jgi:HK97 family phage major capsid protein
LDATIMLTSNGALNPARELARVIPISTREWRGVTSAGVTAEYAAEATEVADASPTLGQPAIVAERGDAFVPFSMELDQDWGSLQSELLRLITDGRDVLDATKHLTGSGTNEPFGVLTGLSTTQRVQTTGAGAFAIGDVYKLKQAIPPRFSVRAAWAVAPAIADTTYRFVGGNSAEPPLFNEARDRLLARPVYEWSNMTTTTTTGSKIAIYGDWNAGYTIVDRLGMTAEIVPHLVGANRRPTGQRGLVVWWRSGAKVVVPEALRYLEVASWPARACSPRRRRSAPTSTARPSLSTRANASAPATRSSRAASTSSSPLSPASTSTKRPPPRERSAADAGPRVPIEAEKKRARRRRRGG